MLRLFFSIVFTAMIPAVYASVVTPARVLLFIDSTVPEQVSLIRDMQRQFYFSQQLQQQLNLTIIDLNTKGDSLTGPANYQKDKQGIWVEKYRPAEIPALFCLKGKEIVYKKITSHREIRSCL